MSCCKGCCLSSRTGTAVGLERIPTHGEAACNAVSGDDGALVFAASAKGAEAVEGCLCARCSYGEAVRCAGPMGGKDV